MFDSVIIRLINKCGALDTGFIVNVFGELESVNPNFIAFYSDILNPSLMVLEKDLSD